MTSINTPQTLVTNEEATLSAEDEHAIRDLVALADRSQVDPAVLPGLHTDATVIVNFYGRRLFGRDAFEAAMSAALGSGLGDVRTSVEIVDIRALAADAVLVSCVKTVHDQRPGVETTPPATGALTYVMVRTSDDWDIGLAQTTPIASE
ncbi:SgcJ/EcaC family oxidoreductase [Micromonospora sp. Llam7]|uniref:SgcJ/EcaC family oxidoreductase n=1 Tax=Micromonospora tarapacensis TaxID=2835305 RepID=UPI001C82D214|nr:SgcJ/EcaC family oxidoreductase [Micromonospora tarapacensis]MBX7268142.1 SgcJ/EcaC family oxidoreductase [Micromonospora tarapacensis]